MSDSNSSNGSNGYNNSNGSDGSNGSNESNSSNSDTGITQLNEKISPITSPYSNFVIERFVRPQEIDNCLIYANKPGMSPYVVNSAECACALGGITWISTEFKNSCMSGYDHAGKNNLITHPDPILTCLKNVPTEFTNTGGVETYDAWLVGCLSGLKGKH